jgi:hypothetical protein
MDGKRLLGLYFFDGPLKENTYLDKMQNWFMPHLETLDMNDDAYFQQDGLPARYALDVREYLSEAFPERYFGCRSPSAGHQRCSLHLTVHFEVQTCRHVIFHFGLPKGNSHTTALPNH